MRLTHPDRFDRRHNGLSATDLADMLRVVGAESLDALADETVPPAIRLGRALDLPAPLSEQGLLDTARRLAAQNEQRRTFIGQGYYGTVTPPAINRHIFQNPNWYTQYTPYQAEIAQGRLEALLNFQTMVSDLTGLPIANASLLDEGTAAAEAMLMLARHSPQRTRFVVSSRVHPQTIDVVQGRAAPMGVDVVVVDDADVSCDDATLGVLLQYPATDGEVVDYRALAEAAHAAGAFVVVATDLLALTLLDAPGAWGADVALGSSQRFGVPLGYGGPHAAFFATHDAFKRTIPGRIIGVTVDKDGGPALRMALQTREQHIRRDKATSNICTAQVLLAVMAQAYAVYHGPDGLRAIATYVHDAAKTLRAGLEAAGHAVRYGAFFDTLRVAPAGLSADDVREACDLNGVNLRDFGDGTFGIALDETVTLDDLDTLLAVFETSEADAEKTAEDWAAGLASGYDGPMPRTTDFLTHPVFHAHRTETDLMRYLTGLSKKDLSLTHSMIPLGSCTMKLNAVAELLPVSLPGFATLHPFVPTAQAAGYHRMMDDLSAWLAEITGFDAVSLQPNSGASGEYAGLMVIRAYHQSRGEGHRTVCLIPDSAHGTNPASAVMAGMKVVPVKTRPDGTVDLADLTAKAEQHRDTLAALMVTYPSTFGVFESGIKDVVDTVHAHGGQVYLDGANMNAMVGLCRPGDIGADVCHLNLHKTFAIPHGGGGPGMGPICMKAHLAPFRPGSVAVDGAGGEAAIPAISAAPYGSASILLISWAYIAMMGAEGLKAASQMAILNANYVMKRLEGDYEIAYVGETGRCAHEFILDLRPLKGETGISEVDCAKRLMDYGYHAPTMSWPVVGTMMIEPTESESKAELDRFVEAMQSIRAEIQAVADGQADRTDNVLKNAPHPAQMVLAETWERPYSREQAAYPAAYVRAAKFWPTVRRVDDAFGDRNLVCTCPPMSEYAEDVA